MSDFLKNAIDKKRISSHIYRSILECCLRTSYTLYSVLKMKEKVLEELLLNSPKKLAEEAFELVIKALTP